MNARLFLYLLFIAVFSDQIIAQNQPKKEYYVGECSKTDISIDGKFNEPVWSKANWQNDFIQYQPVEGKTPRQKTEFAILLDENSIYVGFKCWDSSPC